MARFAEVRAKNIKRVSKLGASLDVVKKTDYAPIFVDKAYDYAINIAPQKTGHLKNAIQKIYQKNQGRIRLVQPVGERGRPYHMWMHGIKTPGGGSPGYDISKGWKMRNGKHNHIKSGIPNFIFKTQEYMTNQTKKSMEKQIKQLFK